MSAHVMKYIPISVALGVPLPAGTRRAASETGLGVLVLLLLHSHTTPIPDKDMIHSLYQTQ